jgi:hypothetical protein
MTWLDEQDQSKVEAALEKFRTSPSYEDAMRYAYGHERFAFWMHMADRTMIRRLGLGIHDIGDWNWRDAFDEGESPTAALMEALAADDTYSAMFSGE